MRIVDTQPSVRDADIDKVEVRLSFKFPADLRRHYLQHNGGRPVPNLFPKDGEYFAVNWFLPIRYSAVGATFERVYVDLIRENDSFPKNIVPIAYDVTGDFFCYSLEPGKFGAICFFQSDYYDDPERAVVYLADSLAQFLDSLVAEPSR